MFKINLVPEVQKEKQAEKKLNTGSTAAAILILGGCILVIAALGGYQVIKRSELSRVNDEIKTTEEEVSKYKELEETVLSLEKGLAGIKQITDGENRWTILLPHLEKATPTDIKFTKLKLSDGKVEADLEGQSINSLARFLESYKSYKVISLSGSGEVGSTVNVKIKDGNQTSLKVKSDGRWIYAVSFDPAQNQEIIIDYGEDKTKATVKYDAKTKNIETNEGSIKAEGKNLFSDVGTDKYDKSGEIVKFTAKFNFDGGAIW